MLEDDAAPVFKRILGEKRLDGLTQREREVVAIFVATQHLRTPNFRETLHGMNVHIASLFRGLGLEAGHPPRSTFHVVVTGCARATGHPRGSARCIYDGTGQNRSQFKILASRCAEKYYFRSRTRHPSI